MEGAIRVRTRFGEGFANLSPIPGQELAVVYVGGRLIGPVTLGSFTMPAYEPSNAHAARVHAALKLHRYDVQIG